MKQKLVNNKSIVVHGSILASASIIVRFIGFFYRIPLIRLLGNVGNGYYSVAFDLYQIVLVISSLSLPIAVSRLVSSKLAKNQYKNAHKVFISALMISIIIGGIASAIVWFGADFFARISIQPLAVYSIKVLAPTLFIVAIMGTFRGYFQGMNYMIPTALSQIIEQIINAVISILAANYLINKGVEYGAAGGTLGTGVGALSGLIFIIILYLFSRPRIKNKIKKSNESVLSIDSYLSITKLLVLTTIPIIFGTVIIQITNYIDQLMFNIGLAHHGYSNNQISNLYGLLSGKNRLILSLPVAAASALSAATIPSITSFITRNNNKELKKNINILIRFIMIFAFPACIGLIVLAKPIMILLFNDYSIIPAQLLQLGSITVIFFSMQSASIAILQSINYLKRPVMNASKALIVNIVFNFILLFIFDTNLYGAVITNIIFAIISGTLNFYDVKKYTNIKFNIKKSFILPLICSIIMGGFCSLIFFILNKFIGNNLSALLSILFSGIIYSILIIKFKVINERELSSLKIGRLVVKIMGEK